MYQVSGYSIGNHSWHSLLTSGKSPGFRNLKWNLICWIYYVCVKTDLLWKWFPYKNIGLWAQNLLSFQFSFVMMLSYLEIRSFVIISKVVLWVLAYCRRYQRIKKNCAILKPWQNKKGQTFLGMFVFCCKQPMLDTITGYTRQSYLLSK